MDDTLLQIIADMVDSKSYSIFHALDVPMHVQFGHSDSDRGKSPSSFRLLKWWRANRVLNPGDGRNKLVSVLLQYGIRGATDLLLPSSMPPSEEGAQAQEPPVWQKPQPVVIPEPKGN